MVHFYKPAQSRSSKKSSVSTLLPSLRVESYTDDGRGIARLPTSNPISADLKGKTIFIKGALEGETVTAQIDKVHSRFIEARCVEIVETSPQRVEPKCEHFGECGGCHTQHMSVNEQHRFKQASLLNQLGQSVSMSSVVLAPTISFDVYHYRRRVRLAVDSRQHTVLGFRKPTSRQVVSINTCPVMSPLLSVLIAPLKQWLSETRVAIGHVEMVLADKTPLVIVRYLKPIKTALRHQLLTHLQHYDQSVCCFFQGDKKGQLETVECEAVASSMNRLRYTLSLSQFDKPFAIGFRPQDFIQANERVNAAMVEQAIDWLKPQSDEHLWDLFCGVGNFSIPLAARAKHVQAYEGLEDMLDVAEDNAKLNALKNIKFIQRDLFDCDQLTRSDMLNASCDGLILDPPRSGAKQVCEMIGRWLPKRIVYVSCNPATFARDAQLLCKQGYRLSRLGLIDMFPQTAHSEVMALFAHPSWCDAESSH